MMKFTGESLTRRGEIMKIRISKEVLPSLPLMEVSSKEKIGVFFRKLGKKAGRKAVRSGWFQRKQKIVNTY